MHTLRLAGYCDTSEDRAVLDHPDAGHPSQGSYVLDFISTMMENTANTMDALQCWVLSPVNWGLLDNALRKSPIRVFLLHKEHTRDDGKLMKSVWYLDNRDSPRIGGSWVLGVEGSSLALTVALNFGSVEEAARHLLHVGSPFFTFVCMTSSPAALVRNNCLASEFHFLGCQPANYCYTATDYQFYIHLSRKLLLQRALRACLSRGGIIWRLAVEHVLPSIVLAGPSAINLAKHNANAYAYHNNQVLVDDKLSMEIVEFLCGTYRHFTGRRKQTGKKEPQLAWRSWWPRPETWDSGDLSHTWWTPMAERWYLLTKAKYEVGDLQPQTNIEWKQKLSTMMDARYFNRRLEATSHTYLQDFLSRE